MKSTPLVTPHATTWSIEDILRHVDDGRLCVPDFQRPFRWDRKDIINLFDSLNSGYPVGNLLIWETDTSLAVRSNFGPIERQLKTSGRLLIVDGQQRITAITATMLGGGLRDSRFNVVFDLRDQAFKHRRSSTEQPDGTCLPLSEIADTVRFLEWLQTHAPPRQHVDAANRMVRSLRDYKLPVYTVRADTDGQIREIFRRLNTTGKALREAEIFNALHGGKDRSLLGEIRQATTKLHFGELNDTWQLRALAATLNVENPKHLSREFGEMTSKEQREAKARVIAALERVVAFLQQDARILHWSLLPYQFPIIPLVAFYARFPKPPKSATRVLTRWLWLGACSGAHAVMNQPAIRAALKAIKDARDPAGAAKTLSNGLVVDIDPAEYDLAPHNFRNAATKIACCVLACAQPRDLVTGKIVNLGGFPDLGQMLQRLDTGKVKGTESRILHPRLGKGDRRNAQAILAAIEQPRRTVAASHLMTDDALECLRSGDMDGFFAKRRHELESKTRAFLEEVFAS